MTFDGAYYETDRATIYDKPEAVVPILVAAGGVQMAKPVGRLGDGLICTSGKAPSLYGELISALEEGATTAGRDPRAIERFIEIKVSYDHDRNFALEACAWWAALALSGEEKTGVDDPVELERLADAAVQRAHTRFIVSDDPDEVVEQIAPYVELGFTHLVFHGPGPDQPRFLEVFSTDVLPRLRERWG